ncbi:S1 RNA-binding domain-containing protein 1 isoform X2 [Anabrus simplex]|uniref:S1 RNA-binding domain-containing protein 1 isoform X2 n=1 Tax=Anabrus simplex TaxID=316456 RepID=UPI0035A3CF95
MSGSVIDLVSDSAEEVSPVRSSRRKQPIKKYISSDEDSDLNDTPVVTVKKKKRSSDSEDEWQPTPEGKEKPSQGKQKRSAARSDSVNPPRKRVKKEKVIKEEPTSSQLKLEPDDAQGVENVKLETEIKNEVESKPAKGVKSTKAPRKPKSETVKRAPRKKKTAVQQDSEIGQPNVDENEFDLLPTGGKELDVDWDAAEVVAEIQQIEVHIARNITRLLDEDNTIPFIARYRKELTNNMEPEKIRHVKETYEMLKLVKQKAASIEKYIAKQDALTPVIEKALRCARTLSELEHIYAPYKQGKRSSKADKARMLGLEPPAVALLEGTDFVDPAYLVRPEVQGLATMHEVELGLQHIIADIMSKDGDLLNLLRKLGRDCKIMLESTKMKETSAKAKAKAEMTRQQLLEEERTKDKFQNYFKFQSIVQLIKPHQVLAINRGESLKVLSVKVTIPEWVFIHLRGFCQNRWFFRGRQYPVRTHMLAESLKDAYERLLQPLLIRQVRSQLTQDAAHAAVEVFAQNLKKLLLSPPMRGKPILGIDPGFRNGCKLAVVSPTGDVLQTDIMFLPQQQGPPNAFDPNAEKLRNMLLNHGCELIALGNGTACRETEAYLGSLIQRMKFKPLDVKYTIVSEQGASIYSCSPLAKKEFPSMDTNMISAVSLARRVQDPLCELVKVEPKHLGVGMYQHDVPEKRLSSTLDEVVSECVSFVGVDLNTASETILRRIAGLNASRAANIIEWRSVYGPFMNRQQLLQVKGIGNKTFEQCAGFIRINPATSQLLGSKLTGNDALESKPGPSKVKKKTVACDKATNPLDRTCIHPESYAVTYKFIDKCGTKLDDFGKQEFNNKISDAVQRIGLAKLAEEMGVPEPQMKLIVDGLQLPPEYDMRSQFEEPLFRRGINSMEDLKSGSILTGRVQNVTHFGTFVDIGVGQNGLIPMRMLRRFNSPPQLGNRVMVKVLNVELARRRISLDLIKIL